ncbi:YfhO family protein [Levilactobacillus brevis]|nr:YfhO family protein [Levilactobacillus brevis]KIO98060.1 hypothetical protein QP38_0749 [Levilactobacillus brevis]KRK19750.1 glycosyltransferase [Levilactobacillus brevis ATCC 14869 = DSM 20054]MCT3572793.1 glycosyltransferase [Levilactobacillus brevis]SQG75866.1 glycosyltransferase [Levilactobacillus brevis]
MKATKRQYAYYTGMFMILVVALYGIFLLTGKSFIWEGDGLAQHYPILEKFYTWLHQGSLTGWSWDLGLGADKLTTFSYYVLGDPFSYLIAFFPKGRLELGYNLLILLRLYASGLAFLFFARQRSFKPASQLVGTLAYTFTGYSLYVSIRHPFFLLPMILFPLLAYGIDHVLSGKSWIPLAIFTGLALISNFYFAYILALGSLVYAVLRYLAIRQTVSLPHWRVLWQLVGAGLTGFLLAGVLFIPSLLGVLSSTRATANFANGYWLYPLNYYLRFPNAIITTGNPLQFWVNLGLSGLTFLALVFVLRHFRRYLWLNISLILLMVGVLLPAVAAVMNGGTTPSQRWLLLGCLAFSLAVMTFVDELPQFSRGDIATLIWSVLGLLIIVWAANGFIYNNHRHDFTMYGLLLLTLGAVIVGSFYQWTPRLWQMALLSLLGLNIVANGYGYFSPNSGGASQQLLARGVATKFQKNYYDGAQRFVKAQGGFHRSATSRYYYYATDAKTNMGMNLGTHDIMSYFSIQNGAIGDFSQAMDNSQFKMNKPINQADGRTTLNNLLGVRTIFARSNQLGIQAFPDGYRPVKRQGKRVTFRDQPVHDLGNNYNTVLLQSKYALPLAYLQTHQLNATQFWQLNGVEREQALTTGALVAGGAHGVPTRTYHKQGRPIAYRVVQDDTTVLDSLKKVVTYRQQGNQNDAQLAQVTKSSLRKKNKDRSVNIRTGQARLKQLTRQNRQILRQNAKKNQHGLRQMTSDNQNNPVTYRLKVDRPQRTAHTELYLELDGIQAQRLNVANNYHGAKTTSAFSNTAYTGIQRLNVLRNALWRMSDGAYSMTVSSFHNVASFNQLGQTNLSDYQVKHRVLLNLGYSAKPRRTIKLTFKGGVKRLNFKSVKLVAVPFGKGYQQRLMQLKRQGLRQLTVRDNRVTGTTQASQASVLTTSIPYSSGWRLTVDGQAQATKRVNVGFIGARLAPGNHRIVLTYHTPGLRIGLFLSGVGLLILLVVGGSTWWYRRK